VTSVIRQLGTIRHLSATKRPDLITKHPIKLSEKKNAVLADSGELA